MIPEPSEPAVLEHNLVRLFARSYVPVRPSPAFRARLAERLARELVAPAASRRSGGWRVAAAVLALAGTLLAVWLATRTDARLATREAWLARGETALREGTSESWRSLSELERSRGVELAAGRLEVATAAASGVRVWVGAAGRADLHPSTALAIDAAEADAHAITLESGAVALERYAPAGRFDVATPEGRLVLERGALAVEVLPASEAPAGLPQTSTVRARLASGVAWLDTQPGRTLLGLASDVYLQRGRIAVAASLDGSTLASGDRSRVAVSPGAVPSTAGSAVDAPATGALRGRVVAPPGSAQPERFVVTLLREVRLPDVSQPERHAFDAEDGRFEISPVDPGTYRVFVEARGFAVWHVPSPLAFEAGSTRDVEVVLDRGAVVRGRVVDADTRAPIEGAVVLSETDAPSQIVPFDTDVEWMRDWLALARSGPDGRFEFPALSRGAHVLRATRVGFGAGWSQRLDLRDGSEAPAPVDVEIALAPGGTVFGRVAHDDGRPRAGAIVIASHMATDVSHSCLSYANAITDADGAFSIVDLAPGMYVVLHAPAPEESEAIDPLVIQVRVERGRATEVHLPGRERGTRLTGRVVRADGTPLADADILVQATTAHGPNDWRAERTRANGEFSFAGLEPATYQVFVGRGLGQNFTWQSDVDVPDAPNHETLIRLDAGVIAGRVRDASTSAGLARSVLILEVERAREWKFCGRGFSAADGRFEFPHLRAGNYRVSAYATRGRFGPERTADLWVAEGGETRDVDIALAPGAALKVRVRDASGKPLENVPIEFVDASGELVQHTQDDVTDAHGELEVPGIRPGRWTVRASARGHETASVHVELGAGDERALDVELQSLSQPK